MRLPRVGISLIVCALLLCNAGLARADRECAGGYRDTSVVERAAMMKVLEAVRAALPPVPAGWLEAGDDSLELPTAICRDDANRPWPYGLYRGYQRVDDLERRERILAQLAERYAADTEAKRPRIDALSVRIQELTTAAIAAAGTADYARIDALKQEIAGAQLELEQVMAEESVFARHGATGVEAARDMHMGIEVAVNAEHVSPGHGAVVASGPAGAAGTWRWLDRSGNVTALILFGEWLSKQDSPAPAARVGAAPTQVQTISIQVTADTDRIDTLVAAIDFARLAALIER